MKLYFMRQTAVEYIKANMNTLYVNYYQKRTNEWIYELFDYDPFEFFMEIPDFALITGSKATGESELENCKILYSKLLTISESQAADERLWAGLCNGVFYNYVRVRWGYPNMPFKETKKDADAVLSRFFLSGAGRSGLYRNTLAKYWWVGHVTYQEHTKNKFEILDALGPEDFTSKVTELFYSYTYSSNIMITKGICNAWKKFRDRGIKLGVREYLRPAVQYLNALGGAVLLDVLSEKEIETLIFDYIYNLYTKGETESIIHDTNDVDDINEGGYIQHEVTDAIKEMYSENIHVPYQVKQEKVIGAGRIDANQSVKLNDLLGKPKKVEYGNSVIVHLEKENKKVNIKIPDKNTEEPSLLQKRLLGKSVGDKFEFYKDNYIIEDISW